MDWSIESSNAASQEVFTVSVKTMPYMIFLKRVSSGLGSLLHI